MSKLANLAIALKNSKNQAMIEAGEELELIIQSSVLADGYCEETTGEEPRDRLRTLVKLLQNSDDPQLTLLREDLTEVLDQMAQLDPVMESWEGDDSRKDDQSIEDWHRALCNDADLLRELASEADYVDFTDALKRSKNERLMKIADELKRVDDERDDLMDGDDSAASALKLLTPPVIWIVQNCLVGYRQLVEATGGNLTEVKEALQVMAEIEGYV